MKTWLHKIAHHAAVAEPLLEKGYLSIGFSELSDSMFITDISSMFGLQSFEDYFLAWKDEKPANRYNLWRFITKMKKGDQVVVPGWRTFSIYELIDDAALPISEINFQEMKDVFGVTVNLADDGLLYSEDFNLIDLGFVRKVKPIQKNIPIADYADPELSARLKSISINDDITELRHNLEKAIVAFEKCQPPSLFGEYTSIILHQLMQTIRSEFSDNRFKDLIKQFYMKLGATSAFIPKKDHLESKPEIDVMAVFEHIKTVFYAYVKFGPDNLNQWISQQLHTLKDFKETMNDGYNKVIWIITSEEVSKEVYNEAKHLHVQIIDGLEFSKMLLERGITNLDTWIHSSVHLCANPINN